MRFLHFILSHSIFIALCAVGFSYRSNIVLHLAPNKSLLLFIFFSTICSYNFYWLLSKFHFDNSSITVAFLKKNSSFIIIFFLASAFTFYYFLQVPFILPYLVISVLLILLYSSPLLPFKLSLYFQKFGFAKTILLAFSWAFITTLFPISANMIGLNKSVIALLFLSNFFYVLLLCILFDSRDAAIDKIHGLHSLATDVSNKSISIIVKMVLLLYLLSSFFLCKLLSNYFQLVANGFSATLFLLLYYFSNKKQGFVFYYFLVDGLMIASAFVTYIADVIKL